MALLLIPRSHYATMLPCKLLVYLLGYLNLALPIYSATTFALLSHRRYTINFCSAWDLPSVPRRVPPALLLSTNLQTGSDEISIHGLSFRDIAVTLRLDNCLFDPIGNLKFGISHMKCVHVSAILYAPCNNPLPNAATGAAQT